jgi:hypothetical protein
MTWSTTAPDRTEASASPWLTSCQPSRGIPAIPPCRASHSAAAAGVGWPPRSDAKVSANPEQVDGDGCAAAAADAAAGPGADGDSSAAGELTAGEATPNDPGETGADASGVGAGVNRACRGPRYLRIDDEPRGRREACSAHPAMAAAMTSMVSGSGTSIAICSATTASTPIAHRARCRPNRRLLGCATVPL